MALFINVEVSPAAAKDAEIVKKLVEVCPVNIFAAGSSGGIEIIDKHLDECTLCEACVPECPEGVMFIRAELANTAWKCDLCGDCVAVCGTSALWIAEKEAAPA